MKTPPSRLALTLGLALALLVTGCASGPTANPRDPLEPLNRKMSQFNEGVDSVFLKPVATAYREVLPPGARTVVANVFGNLGDAWSGVNALAQFKLRAAADNFLRFGVNSVFGFGGVLDLASEFQIERHKEDFGQTLGRWGVPAGPYVVLPLLGPSTLRDALALPVERKGDLLREVKPLRDQSIALGLRTIDVRANLLRTGNMLDEAALDKYSFTRDAYLQKRRAEVFDGDDPEDGDANRDARP